MNPALLSQLHWELTVLARAVAYPNLSAAAGNIGISQPQLSRMVAKLESALGVTLLDRSSPRKSAWLPIAFELAETYSRSARRMELELRQAVEGKEQKQLRVGILEGFVHWAVPACHRLLKTNPLELLELDIYDLADLESHFTKGELDAIVSIRTPGRKKFAKSLTLGVQRLKLHPGKQGHCVLSSFEAATRRDLPADMPKLISNSLEVRKLWLEQFGGYGWLPSPLERKKSATSEDTTVLLLGQDVLDEKLWKALGQAYS